MWTIWPGKFIECLALFFAVGNTFHVSPASAFFIHHYSETGLNIFRPYGVRAIRMQSTKLNVCRKNSLECSITTFDSLIRVLHTINDFNIWNCTHWKLFKLIHTMSTLQSIIRSPFISQQGLRDRIRHFTYRGWLRTIKWMRRFLECNATTTYTSAA